MSSKLIFSLDAGTSKVVSLVGTFENKINIIGFSSHHYVQNTKNNESEDESATLTICQSYASCCYGC